MKKILLLISTLAFMLSFASCQKDSSKDGPDPTDPVIELKVPENLALSEYGKESIKMTWSPVEKAEYYTYKIIATVINDGEAQDSLVLMGKTFNTFKTIVKLDSINVKNGYHYWFSVAAGAGKRSASEYSSYVRCEPGGLTPYVPTEVKQTACSENGLTFSWQPSEESEFYRYELTNPKGQVIKTGDTKETSVTIDGLKKGRYYYLSVAGANPNKVSSYTTRVEGLTYGTYIPALTFNASFAEDCFSFVEGTELTVTDGVYTAGYVVKSSGKTTTLELTTEEEVQYNQPKYTAMMPIAIHDGGEISGKIVKAEDGTFAGVPCWAETDGTNMVFHSYYSVITLNVSSAKSQNIDKIAVRAEKALSGKVVSATIGAGAKLEFESSDKSLEFELDEPVKIGTTPSEIDVLAPIGSYENLCAVFENEGAVVAGNLCGIKEIKEAEKQTSNQEFKIIEEVRYASMIGATSKIMANATIKTGTFEDYDFGFLKTTFLEENWNTAEFIPGTIVSSSSGTAIFEAFVGGLRAAYLRPCVKPKGTPNVLASTGEKCFIFDLDFSDPNLIQPATQAQANMVGLAAFGNEFPTTKVKIANKASLPQHCYSVNGFPFSAGTGSQSGDRSYSIYWDKNAKACLTYKMRFVVYGNKVLKTFKPTYLYWKCGASKKYFVGNSSSAGSCKYGNVSTSLMDITLDTMQKGGIIYFGCDTNTENTQRLLLFLVEQI